MRELNFDRQKPSLFTLSSHIWDCNALSWLHEHTPGEQFKRRGGGKGKRASRGVSEILCRTRVDVFGERGGSHVVSMERISPALYCKLLCSSSKPRREQGAANARIIAAVDVRTCVCV